MNFDAFLRSSTRFKKYCSPLEKYFNFAFLKTLVSAILHMLRA